jgi:hypothetical protein
MVSLIVDYRTPKPFDGRAILPSLACPAKYQRAKAVTLGALAAVVGRPDAEVHKGVELKKRSWLSVF